MARHRRYLAAAAAVALVAPCAAAAAPAAAEPVSDARLLDAGSERESANWLMVHRTYDAHRYSPLSQIDRATVGGLKLAFAVPLGGWGSSGHSPSALQGTPLANDGFLYVTDGWGTVYKIDVRAGDRGRIVWKTDLDVDQEITRIPVNRGAALYEDLVFTNLIDGRVAAIDDASGEIVWERQVGTQPGEGFSGAPLVAGGRLLVGQSMGDWLTRGFVAALEPRTGKELWRFYAVPAPGEPGSETWRCDDGPAPDCWRTGGGGVWATGSYDARRGLYITGTGNPAPAYDPQYRPGDNLYTNSAIALDVRTGKLAWHFQYTPNDYMELDETGVHMLVERPFEGRQRPLVAHFGRNGFFYVLDRDNGAFLRARQYVERVTWTAGIDARSGKPLGYEAGAAVQEYAPGTAPRRDGRDRYRSCPHAQGGVNFWPTAYNPDLGLYYGASLEACSITVLKGEAAIGPKSTRENRGAGEMYLAGGYVADGVPRGALLAVDPASGETVRRVELEYPNYSGVLATAGGLIFTGHMDGTVAAYDAVSLERLWYVNVGVEFQAPPMSFAVDGRQYVAILGGGGGIGPMVNSFGRTELQTMERAYVLWVFAL